LPEADIPDEAWGSPGNGASDGTCEVLLWNYMSTCKRLAVERCMEKHKLARRVEALERLAREPWCKPRLPVHFRIGQSLKVIDYKVWRGADLTPCKSPDGYHDATSAGIVAWFDSKVPDPVGALQTLIQVRNEAGNPLDTIGVMQWAAKLRVLRDIPYRQYIR
jgi:hypothetical protein